MKTFEQLAEWCTGASRQLGDPSKPVCQLFLRYRENLANTEPGDLLDCGVIDGELVLMLGPAFMPYPLPIEMGEGDYDADGIRSYGIELVTRGVWSVTPSFFVPGVIHAFISVYDVPDLPPWERRILLPPGVRA